MAATEAKWAQGTILARNGTTIAQVKTIGDLELTQATLDATHLESDDDFEEFVGGKLSTGDLPITGDFKPGDTNGQIGLHTDLLAHTLQSFVLTLPTALATSWTFSALVTSFKTTGVSVDGIVGFAATLKISGKPTLGITASTGLTTPFFAISESAVVTPDEASAVYEYVGTVLTGVTSVTVTPTAAAGVIKVNGNTVATGVASSAITLGAAGSVTEITITVTETNKTTKTYTIWLARAAA